MKPKDGYLFVLISSIVNIAFSHERSYGVKGPEYKLTDTEYRRPTQNEKNIWKETQTYLQNKDVKEEMQDVLDFIKQGELEIQYPKNTKNVVLILGNTGAGKSTFAQWIAGDDSKLMSVEKGKGLGEFLIYDNNRIGKSTIISKTVFPELVIDKDTGTAYYDISGFGDTRSMKHDIATTYFIKKILDHVEKIKIILCIPYSSLKEGENRTDFTLLLRHITELFTNIDKYLDSFMLIATKLEHKDAPDITFKENIANFMQSVSFDLAYNADALISPEDVPFVQSSGKLINALTSDNGSYTKIALFKRPNQSGPLNEIPLLIKSKLKVKDMIMKTKFVECVDNDFGYTVSLSTKNHLTDLFDVMKKNITASGKDIISDIENQFQNEIKNIHDKINNVVLNSSQINADIETIITETEKIKVEINELRLLENNLKRINIPRILYKSLNMSLEKLNLTSPTFMLDIKFQVNFIDFLRNSVHKQYRIDTSPIVLVLVNANDNIKKSIKSLDENVKRLQHSLEASLVQNVKNAGQQLRGYFENQEKELNDTKEVNRQIEVFRNRVNEINNNTGESYVVLLKNVLKSYNVVLNDFTIKTVTKNNTQLTLLKNEIGSVLIYTQNSQKWYNFIKEFYKILSQYQIQSSDQNKNHCKMFLHNHVSYAGKPVKDTNFEFLLAECNLELYKKMYEGIKNINLNSFKLDLIKKITNVTLNQPILQTCDSLGELVVKGYFVKFSDIRFDLCPSDSVTILAVNKVFVDKDLKKPGSSIIIIAPIFEIIGNRYINLDGQSGEWYYEKPSSGYDGKFGKHGSNGGHFLVLGDQFINGKSLSISANGGNGGKGQDGGDGQDGKDGHIPTIAHPEETYPSLAREPQANENFWSRHGYHFSSNRRYLCGFPLIMCRDYVVKGKPCTNGSNGGRAGAGGLGGKAGTIKAFKDATFVVSAVDGKDGANGKPGQPGRAGRRSGTIQVSERRKCRLIVKKKFYSIVKINQRRCKSGSIDVHLKTGESQRVTMRPPRAGKHTIIEYKTYLNQNMDNLSVLKSYWKKFCNYLDTIQI